MFDPAARLFLRFRGKTTGPFSLAQIEQMRQLGRVTAFHEVSADGVRWMLTGDAGLVVSASMGQNPGPILGATPEPTPVEDLGPPWYHLDSSGARQGPFPRERMAEMIAGGRLTATSEVWCEGFADWVRLDQTELSGSLPRGPAAAGAQPANTPALLEGNGLVVVGYLCCVGAGFVCPPLFGVAALTCAVVNLRRRRVAHGLAQLFLSIVMSSAGSLLAYLVWQEIGKK